MFGLSEKEKRIKRLKKEYGGTYSVDKDSKLNPGGINKKMKELADSVNEYCEEEVIRFEKDD